MQDRMPQTKWTSIACLAVCFRKYFFLVCIIHTDFTNTFVKSIVSCASPFLRFIKEQVGTVIHVARSQCSATISDIWNNS